MKKLFSIVAACVMTAAPMTAQHSYMAAPGVAVFYPARYDASAHSPSPIFERELAPQGDVPASWQIRPVYSEQDGKRVCTLHVGSDVDLYGGGEVWGPLRRNGKTIRMWNIDTPAYGVDGGSHLYQSHPWVMGLRPDGTAFGIIADNTWKSDMTTDQDVVFRSEGPAFRVIVIERDNPEEMMRALGELTGTMQLPPLWALGYQQCRFSYHPDTRVKEIADTLRLQKIPSDVIWMDIHYMDKYRVFTFNPQEFPDPKGLNDYLHSKHFKSVYMIDPGVKAEKGYWVDDQGMANDFFVKDKDGKPFEGNVWPGACHFPDFTRPEVRAWWATLYPPFMANGIDGIWNDMNEPSVFGGPDGTMPVDNQHQGGDGLKADSHLRYHNVFGMNMVRASREGLLLANPTKRPFVLSRSNFLGGHRYAATWTGDNYSNWDQFRHSIPMSLTLGLSGQPFNGPDIGGFCGSSTASLVANWTAVGVFFPFVRNHTIDGSVNQEPWAFDTKTTDVCRTSINRRYRLMPYVYTLFQEASQTGMPVMRPAFMADSKDRALRAEQQAFMLGADLYIIPRWAPDVSIPAGDWDVLQLESTDDGVQPYVAQRPGSIVPMANLY
ncbi:MAG: alpha-glucosidase, partial [Bacteroidaceae bacterium]|nr:alpha-glucosidase [Bacteroidaceae bacterium]